MRSVTQGNLITFTVTFPAGGDPTDTTVIILRDNVPYSGNYTLVAGQVARLSSGVFRFTWIVPDAAPLVTYVARYTGTVENVLIVINETFEVISENELQVSSLLSPPVVRGSLRVSPLYNVLGQGLTDKIFLLGHADGLDINDPYVVTNMQVAINKLEANPDSPLLRALLEAYYAGARDITLVAVAPMTEYVSTLAHRTVIRTDWDSSLFLLPSDILELSALLMLGEVGKTYYQQYNERLGLTYKLLEQWDNVDIIIPVEASFYGTGLIDMLTPLTQHCSKSFGVSGRVRIGMLGSRGQLLSTNIPSMVADARLETQGSPGKFVTIIAGDVTFNFPELGVAHSTSPTAAAAGLLSSLPLNRGLTYVRLPNVLSPMYANPTKDEIRQLAEAKINPVIRTIKGRRQSAYETVLATDNTVARDGSDFWSLVQLRLSAQCIASLQSIAAKYIGSTRFDQFKEDCQKYLLSLSSAGLLRSFDLNVTRSKINYYKAIVDVYLKPYFGLREIYFNIEVGPNEQ